MARRFLAQTLLTPAQLGHALSLTRIAARPISPLPRDVAPVRDVVAGAALTQRGLVVAAPRPRLNRLFGVALSVAASPDLVLRLQTDAPGRPGLVLCRRGGLVVECTPGPRRVVNLAFPLTPALVARSLAEPLAGGQAAATPFRFAGDSVEVAVLAAALDADRANRPLDRGALAVAVGDAIVTPKVFLPLTLLGGAPELLDAAGAPGRIERAIDALVGARVLDVSGGRVVPAAAAREALAQPWRGAVTVQRDVWDAGRVRTSAFSLVRAGATTLLFRRSDGGSSARYEWSVVDRAQARALLMAAVFSERELRDPSLLRE